MGMDTDNRGVEFFTVPVKPVLHVAALVGVVDQDIGFGDTVDIKDLCQGCNTFDKSTDIGGEV